MNFKLNFDIDESSIKLSHSDEIMLIGSCFSDEITSRLTLNGFQNLANPFGTLFHPLAISNALNSSVSESVEINLLKSNDVFHAWDSAGVIHGYSEKELRDKVNEKRSQTLNYIKHAKFLLITFGTSWSYKHLELDIVVGNCHKENQSTFEKRLNSVEEMKSEWIDLIKKIKSINKKINIVFTVSPVRHKKDGLINNNRSKARLIELTHELNECTGSTYFPSYEILIDELRDYRFYNDDLVHPSDSAVDYVWSKFEKSFCTPETIELSRKVKQIKLSLGHRSLYPKSESHQLMKEKMELKKQDLLKKHPNLKF